MTSNPQEGKSTMNEETPVKGFRVSVRSDAATILDCEAANCGHIHAAGSWPISTYTRARLMEHRATHKASDYPDQVLPWADEVEKATDAIHGVVIDWGGGQFQVSIDGDTISYPTGSGTWIPDPKPTTCQAIMYEGPAQGQTGLRGIHLLDADGNSPYACTLPEGHHPLSGHLDCCEKRFDDPIHSPGHMTAQEAWMEG